MNLTPVAKFTLPPIQMKVNINRQVHTFTAGCVASANYTLVAQSRDEMLVPENSPSISMWPYLLQSAQTARLNRISVYAERGTSREQSRILYLNADALRVWREMRMPTTIIGESHRPSRNAMLCFGMPFSE